jgi:hypothetical protein
MLPSKQSWIQQLQSVTQLITFDKEFETLPKLGLDTKPHHD